MEPQIKIFFFSHLQIHSLERPPDSSMSMKMLTACEIQNKWNTNLLVYFIKSLIYQNNYKCQIHMTVNTHDQNGILNTQRGGYKIQYLKIEYEMMFSQQLSCIFFCRSGRIKRNNKTVIHAPFRVLKLLQIMKEELRLVITSWMKQNQSASKCILVVAY